MQIGDCIELLANQAPVTTVEKVIDYGVYVVITSAEYVIVNGVVASPFPISHFGGNLIFTMHKAFFGMFTEFFKSVWAPQLAMEKILSALFFVSF